MSDNEEHYGEDMISMLELVWGEGWLSPGGPDEVNRLLDGISLEGKSVLDIGCGVGGIDFYLVEKYRAGHITAIDVEDGVLNVARERARARGLEDRIDFVKVEPGPLPFDDGRFDVVFSKDAMVHIADKHALMSEVYRVLKSGGRFVASDWMLGKDGPPSDAMKEYIKAEGLDFGMASASTYRDALIKAGFSDVRMTSRNAWYTEMAKKELMTMSGELKDVAVKKLGAEYVNGQIDLWGTMIGVLESGDHAPTHMHARKV